MAPEFQEPTQEKYFYRELSWLEFNRRVLAEAMEISNPILERLKFIGIVSSNFDEFFMVRVASLDGGDPLRKKVYEQAYAIIEEQNSYFMKIMVPVLEQAGIARVKPQALTDAQSEHVKNLFYKNLLPLLTPISIDENRPVPVLANLSLFMVFRLSKLDQKEGEKRYALVEMPKNFPRMITLPAEKGHQFIFIEDLVSKFAGELFAGYEITDQGLVRITRAAEMTLDEEKDQDFAQIMSQALRERRYSEIVRFEVSASADMTEFLQKKLELKNEQIQPVDGWFDLKAVSQIAFQPILEDLKRPAWVPRPSPEFDQTDSVWPLLKQKPVWTHHPYESFDSFLEFLHEAASDPDVLAIKQTLYRTDHRSDVISILEQAAENGKQVTVLVELKARFDEEKNIEWARRLEQAGATVLYGVRGFKTHAKACLIIRREPDGIRRYAHLSTGNYNEKTARLYSDIGFFTADEAMTADISAFFNVITGVSQPVGFSKIEMAPFGLRRRLKRLIVREAMRSRKEEPGLIIAKMNSLVDTDMIEALYHASQAGVKIKLNVRGICCLRPGVKGLSENIEVTSIVDMFLEHSRIFYFQNGGDSELYLSSADWMPRNLDRRVEIMFPVEDSKIKSELHELLKYYFKDNVKSWELLENGRYQKNEPGAEKEFRVQEYLCKKALERESSVKKNVVRELKPQKPVHGKSSS